MGICQTKQQEVKEEEVDEEDSDFEIFCKKLKSNNIVKSEGMEPIRPSGKYKMGFASSFLDASAFCKVISGFFNISPKYKEEINSKFHKSITELSVSSDVPRMIQRTTVTNSDNDVVFERLDRRLECQLPRNNIALIKEFLCSISMLLDPSGDLMDIIDREFYNYIPMDYEGDAKESMKLLMKSIFVDEKSLTAGVLKCMNQGIVAPAIFFLRMSLINKINYKDYSNHWDIFILQNELGVQVTHKKTEQTIPPGAFFTWELILNLKNDGSCIRDLKFSVISMEFQENLTESEKYRIFKALEPLTHPELPRDYCTFF